MQERDTQLSRLLSLNEKLNSEDRADAEVVTWKFKYEKAEQAKHYAQMHQKTVEVAFEKKDPYETETSENG